MSRALRVAAVVFAACFVFSLEGRSARAAAAQAPARATCVLIHPAFAGKCTETAEVPEGSTARQACESILSCMNNVACTKTYCQATTIRQGWKLESAELKPKSGQ
jgi:hypothetical protein